METLSPAALAASRATRDRALDAEWTQTQEAPPVAGGRSLVWSASVNTNQSANSPQVRRKSAVCPQNLHF